MTTALSFSSSLLMSVIYLSVRNFVSKGTTNIYSNIQFIKVENFILPKSSNLTCKSNL